MSVSLWRAGTAVRIGAAAVIAVGAAAPASAQIFLTSPNYRPGPIEPSDPLVGIPIPGATPSEYRANLLWNLRAGLNVAALQCQFSPFLRVVQNYNGILAHHSEELAAAYTVLNNYFKRVKGAVAGQKAFDDFSTVTYNNWSTLQAQWGFCQVASNIAKSALATPKGQFAAFAANRIRELRNSLVPAYDTTLPPYNPYMLPLKRVPSLADDCWTRENLLKAVCDVAY
jgi:hypothetical protein